MQLSSSSPSSASTRELLCCMSSCSPPSSGCLLVVDDYTQLPIFSSSLSSLPSPSEEERTAAFPADDLNATTESEKSGTGTLSWSDQMQKVRAFYEASGNKLSILDFRRGPSNPVLLSEEQWMGEQEKNGKAKVLTPGTPRGDSRKTNSTVTAVLRHTPKLVLTKRSNFNFIPREELFGAKDENISITHHGATSTDDAKATATTVATYFNENPHLSNGSTLVPSYHMVHLSQLGNHVKLLLKRGGFSQQHQQQQQSIPDDESSTVRVATPGTVYGGTSSNEGTKKEESEQETEKGGDRCTTGGQESNISKKNHALGLPCAILCSSKEVLSHLRQAEIDVPARRYVPLQLLPQQNNDGLKGEEVCIKTAQTTDQTTAASPFPPEKNVQRCIAVWTAIMIKKPQEVLKSDQWFYVGIAYRKVSKKSGRDDDD